MQMEKDWLKLQRYNLSVINGLLSRPLCEQNEAEGGNLIYVLPNSFKKSKSLYYSNHTMGFPNFKIHVIDITT
jgi:hypothetical protein